MIIPFRATKNTKDYVVVVEIHASFFNLSIITAFFFTCRISDPCQVNIAKADLQGRGPKLKGLLETIFHAHNGSAVGRGQVWSLKPLL